MSVRRLHPVQPESFAFTPDNLAWAKATIAKYPPGKQASAVIPLLWRAQEQNAGWVSRPAIEYVARLLDMAFIRVYEVATFYTMFQLSPVGSRAHVQLCGTTPCMLRGAEELKKICQQKIHPEPHHLSSDGQFSWEEVECLGACVNAPMVQIWKDTYEDLTPDSFARLLDDLASGRPVKPGPQIDRQFSAPLGGPTTLTDKSLYGGTARKRPEPMAPAAKPAQIEDVAATSVAAPLQAVDLNPARPRPVKKAAGKAVVKEAAPELLKKPRGGRGDDLKLIWGVGPKLEKMLNAMGIWHFAQIAGWSRAELKWVDERLEGFKGRAERDEWIKQAKKLAKGWRPGSAVGEKPK